jgi:hypothetical protein
MDLATDGQLNGRSSADTGQHVVQPSPGVPIGSFSPSLAGNERGIARIPPCNRSVPHGQAIIDGQSLVDAENDRPREIVDNLERFELVGDLSGMSQSVGLYFRHQWPL